MAVRIIIKSMFFLVLKSLILSRVKKHYISRLILCFFYFLSTYPLIFELITLIRNVLYYVFLLKYFIYSPFRCLISFIYSSAVSPYIFKTRIYKGIRKHFYYLSKLYVKKFKTVLSYELSLILLGLLFYFLSPYCFIYKAVGLLIISMVFLLNSIYIILYIEVVKTKLIKSDPIIYICLLTLSIIFLIISYYLFTKALIITEE